MLKTFHPEHLPIIGEFALFTAVMFVCRFSKNKSDAKIFFAVVKERCCSQGMRSETVDDALNPLIKAVNDFLDSEEKKCKP